MGWRKFKLTCGAGPLGMDPILLTDKQAQDAVKLYRENNPFIVKSWNRCEDLLVSAAKGIEETYGCLRTAQDAIILPNGMSLQYPNLHATEGGWTFGTGKKPEYTYGAKIQENIVQALARIVMADQLLEMERRGVHTVSTTHDEIIAVAQNPSTVYKLMVECMSTSPVWCEGLKFTAKGGFAANYCK